MIQRIHTIPFERDTHTHTSAIRNAPEKHTHTHTLRTHNTSTTHAQPSTHPPMQARAHTQLTDWSLLECTKCIQVWHLNSSVPSILRITYFHSVHTHTPDEPPPLYKYSLVINSHWQSENCVLKFWGGKWTPHELFSHHMVLNNT